MLCLGGIDIGGTKCAVSLGELTDNGITLIDKIKFPTPETPQETIVRLQHALTELLDKHGQYTLKAIGISCGGPLDSKEGVLYSPAVLPGWDRVPIVAPFRERFHVPVQLQNDANACALAEWRWGAGKGCRNMVFLTFGTGMGAGLILDGKLYSGTNDMAGEIGHVRLEKDGPIGHNKPGSFEGFCGGGNIPFLAKPMAEKKIREGDPPLFCPTLNDLPHITTQKIGEAAQQGDQLAVEIFHIVARQLGRGISILIDVLNPERIVLGSIYVRQRAILEPVMLEEVRKEALSRSLSVCQIVPAGLEEHVGDYASLSVAWSALENHHPHASC